MWLGQGVEAVHHRGLGVLGPGRHQAAGGDPGHQHRERAGGPGALQTIQRFHNRFLQSRRRSFAALLSTATITAEVSGVTWRAGGGARLQVVLLARLLTLPSTWSWLCRRKATSARSGDTQGPGSPRIIAAAADSAGVVYLLELETKVHPKVRNHGEGPY